MAHWAGTKAEADSAPLTPRPSPQRLPRAVQRATVFVVDDDALARRAVIDMLSTRFDVKEFGDGESALAALGHTWPDAVLLDVVLPGLDGVEICRRMKQKAGEQALPIVLVTALDGTSERLRGIEAGADDFLPKPVHKVELRARVGNLVKLGYYQKQQSETSARLDTMKGHLEEADRLATLGTFAAGVGHEINNIATVLHSVLGDVQQSAVDEDLKADLASATTQLQELARAMQRVARPVQTEQQVDVREVVRDVLWMTRILGRTKYVQVEFTPPAAAMVARLVPAQVQQVVLNLVTNSADALARSPRGRICISLSCEQGFLHLSVADNGPGLSEEAQGHLFEPLFTTKQPGLGTGLGLPLVRQLVMSWGGTVEIETRAGEGTTVRLRFPCERVVNHS
jgi:signal transduction histidine kinase